MHRLENTSTRSTKTVAEETNRAHLTNRWGPNNENAIVEIRKILTTHETIFSEVKVAAPRPVVPAVGMAVIVNPFADNLKYQLAGKHVYCRRPLGRDIGKAVRMLDTAERRGIPYNVAQLYRRLAEGLRENACLGHGHEAGSAVVLAGTVQRR